jgi:hypothetical protein
MEPYEIEPSNEGIGGDVQRAMYRYETAGRRVIAYRPDGSEFVAVELKRDWTIEDLVQDPLSALMHLRVRNTTDGTAYVLSFREAAAA